MRYAAFLSYSHADARWAQWLHRRLEAYRVPARLVGTPGPDGPIGARLGTIFRDRDELPTAGDLGTTIRAALAESAALIVICSPASARSPWVQAEIEAFRALDRGDRIFCFIVDGDPGTQGQGCFAPALTGFGPDGVHREPLAADARPDGDGRDRAFLKLVAGLLGVSYDALARREAQRRQRRLLAVTTASVCGMAFAIALAATAYIARNDAQRRQAQAEDILGFMLGDLREKLTTVGRLDLMRAVDDKATGYFATLKPRDLSDRALEEQARSLTGIGQVRLDEGHHDQAMAAFREAYERSRALAQREPGNGQRLFDRAQAEYWIGLVNWRQNRFDDAGLWFRRYRDSALRLSALDPRNFAWQREVAYGYHNLAVLQRSRGDDRQAEQGFRAELSLYRGWMLAHPRDTSLRDEASNAASFLGSIAQDDGRLDEARALFAEQLAAQARNRRDEPDNAVWKKGWLDAQVLLTDADVARGDRAAATRGIADAMVMAKALAAQDPGNREWQYSLGVCHLRLARLEQQADPVRSEDDATVAEHLLAAVHAAAPDDDRFMRTLADTRLLLAELAAQRQDIALAGHWLAQADSVVMPAWRQAPNDDLRRIVAKSRWIEGNLAEERGDDAAAQRAWAGGVDLLRGSPGKPVAFDRLDLLARLLQSQHRDAEAAPVLARLAASGYTPLMPFARPMGPAVAAQ